MKIKMLIIASAIFCGCESSLEKAERLYNEAMAEDSIGTVDSKIAKLEESGNLGCGKAFYELGNLYCDTTKSKVDSLKAFRYYQKADSLGLPEATSQLGVLYMRAPKGVSADTVKAVELFKKAGENNTGAGYYQWAVYYETKNDSTNLRKYLEKALELEYPRAYGWTAFNLLEENKNKEAIELLRKGVELGDINSIVNMGFILTDPQRAAQVGIEPDGAKGVEYLKRVADEYPEVAYVHIGWVYGYGYGVEKDEVKALYWFKKAADHNDMVGLYNYGISLYFGRGCNVDKKTAKEYFKKSAALGYESAKKALKWR